MHKEILTSNQVQMLEFVKSFCPEFGLVGGTAIALQIGHRESVDFDLFSLKEFDIFKLKKKVNREAFIGRVLREEEGQFAFFIDDVQFTFFHYPYPIVFSKKWQGIMMPDLLTLAAMKVFALGRRAKWKDYVDLYFIIKDHYSINKICAKAKEIFQNEFNEKIIREQLAYFDDINYSEPVVYKEGFAVPDEEVKCALTEFALEK